MNDAPLLLTYQQAAELLQVSDRTVYSLVKSGQLNAVKLGKHRNSPARIERRALDVFIHRMRQEGSDHEQSCAC